MVKLDAIDVKILTALQNDGRMTKVKLAQTVNLSVSPCWERLKRLERAGVVAGYRAERSEEHTSELQSHHDLVCRLLLEKKKNTD